LIHKNRYGTETLYKNLFDYVEYMAASVEQISPDGNLPKIFIRQHWSGNITSQQHSMTWHSVSPSTCCYLSL